MLADCRIEDIPANELMTSKAKPKRIAAFMASGNSGITIGSGLPRLAGGRRTGAALAEREAARIARSSARFRSRSMRPKVQRIDAALISGRKEGQLSP
jgi:hypothetical protein